MNTNHEHNHNRASDLVVSGRGTRHRASGAGRVVGVAAVAAASSLLLSLPGHAGSAKQHGGLTCRGLTATHVDANGGPGNDVIVVTMAGLDIDAGNGDDLICVSAGDFPDGSTIRGGSGRDSVVTYSGSNYIYGGGGDDSLMSNSSDFRLDGEGDNDTIYMGADFDLQVYGGTGNDRIMGSSSSIDSIFGGSGNDHIIGFGYGDHLWGETGDDRLEGREGEVDDLHGGDGTDTCIDSAAPDTMFDSCEDIVATRNTSGIGSYTG